MIYPKLKMALIGLMVVATTQFAAAASVNGKQFSDWQGRCEKPQGQAEVCYLLQTLAQKDKPPVMITAIGYRSDQVDPVVIFTVSSALDATKDVQFKVDKNQPIGLNAQCDDKQCRIGFPLDKRMMSEFKRGNEGVLAFILKDSGEPAYFSISLRGFTKGIGALK